MLAEIFLGILAFFFFGWCALMALTRVVLHWEAIKAIVFLLALAGVGAWALTAHTLDTVGLLVGIPAALGLGYLITDGMPWLWRRGKKLLQQRRAKTDGTD